MVSTNAVSTNMPLIGYLEQIFLILREKLGEMMTLFHTVAFCGHLWQCFKKMANLVHKSNVCSFWLETLCQGQKNSEANFCFPRHNVFQPKGYIFLGFHPLTLPLHFNWFYFILSWSNSENQKKNSSAWHVYFWRLLTDSNFWIFPPSLNRWDKTTLPKSQLNSVRYDLTRNWVQLAKLLNPFLANSQPFSPVWVGRLRLTSVLWK